MRSAGWLEALWKTGNAPEGTWIFLAGSSMEPAYGDGDCLLVKPLAGAESVTPGEVVVARRGGRLVTHRLVELHHGMATTKGDAVPRVDPPVTAASLLGRVVQARRLSYRSRTYLRAKQLVLGLKNLTWWRRR